MTAEALDEIEVGRKYAARTLSRFLALRDIRFSRLKATLSQRQQEFVELLPLLFHSNHPGLPGFVSTECPADLPDYRSRFVRPESFAHPTACFHSALVSGRAISG